MAKRSKRDRASPSQGRPPPEYSVHSGVTKPHTSFSKSAFLPEEHSSCPPIAIRTKHQRGFHPSLTEQGIAPLPGSIVFLHEPFCSPSAKVLFIFFRRKPAIFPMVEGRCISSSKTLERR